MKRRDLLKALPLGVVAAGVPFSVGGLVGRAYGKNPLLDSLLNAQSNDGKVLVVINLQGGNDGLNTIIPYQDPLYDTNRKTIGFISPSEKATLATYAIGQSGMAFNPNLDDGKNAKFKKLFSDGKLAILQNVGYATPNLSHFRSTDIWNTASDSEIVLGTGWIGRYLEDAVDPSYPTDVQSGDDPLAVQIGPTLSPIFQGSKVQMGIAVSDPSKYSAATNYPDDPPTSTNAGAELAFVRSILEQSDIYGARFKALFPNGVTPTSTTVYPTSGNALAMELQKVAWCVKLGMKTKVYFVSVSGFDTHVNQNSKDNTLGQGLLLNYLSEAISLFQANLEEWGIADQVVGMTYSEFGRRVNENGSKGTDHGTCAPQFVFGSQVVGGLYGPNPNLSDLDSNLDLKWQIDFRQMYASVLGDWFGVSKSFRKAILNDSTSGAERFDFAFAPNGSTTKQSLFKNPQAVSRSAIASNFDLYQNYPNPFNPTTEIRFALSASDAARLEVFDSRGSLVSTVLNERLGRGEHSVRFDASRLASGTYFYRLQVGSEVQTRSMVLVK